jgi:hypothetical protein
MSGRAWFRGPVGLVLEIGSRDSEFPYSLIEYVGGIMDTLDGSHGMTFTYLPIVYEDDCQITILGTNVVSATGTSYRLELRFLADRPKWIPPDA